MGTLTVTHVTAADPLGDLPQLPPAMHLDLEQWGRLPKGAKPAPLSREDEQRLFRLFRAERHRGGDADLPNSARRVAAARAAHLREYLVRANALLIGYAHQLVRRRRATHDLDELLSHGMWALLRAVDAFDPDKGFRFSSYAVRTILNAFSLVAAKEAKGRERLPTCDLYEDSGAIVDADNTVAQEQREALHAAIAGNAAELTDDEWYIIEYRYMGPHPATLPELGRAMGVTKERVRQLERRAIEKLRTALAPGDE